MKIETFRTKAKQEGFATLTISVLILLLLTIFTVYTANSIRKSQKIASDQYRTEQSLKAAQAGFDWMVDFYNTKGLDDDGTPGVDWTPSNQKTFSISDLPSGELTVSARAFFCDTDLDTDGDGLRDILEDPENCASAPDHGGNDVGIVSIGFSDDLTARRVATLEVAPLSPYPGGNGPLNPLTAGSVVDATGNITVINRYHRMNIWSGNTLELGQSATVETFVGDPSGIPQGIARFDPALRTMMTAEGNGNSIPGALPGSSRKRGNNSDVFDSDPVLGRLIKTANPDCSAEPNPYFFCAFFNVTKSELVALAESGNQHFAGNDCQNASGKNGVIYISGNCTINGGQINIGTASKPAMMIVDGDLDFKGGTLYGLLYVTGNMTTRGGFVTRGAVVVENNYAQCSGDAGDACVPPPGGAGSGTFIYDPFAVNPGEGFDNARGIIPGTWKDWVVN